MAVPFRKVSKTRKRMRRSHNALEVVGTTKCPECGVGLTPPSEPKRSPVPLFVFREKTDWANYIYECWIIGWSAWKRSFTFTGRSSRREFWSYFILTLPALSLIPVIGFLMGIIGAIAVGIRRMHDINKCGWWSLVPVFVFFWELKKSDEGPNRYGAPEPAKSLLN